MSTLQENQSLNAEYERNKKEREMKEEIERQKEVINGMIENEEKYCLEINRLKSIIKEVREKVNIIQFKIESTTKNYNNLYIDLKSTLQGQELLEILDKEN